MNDTAIPNHLKFPSIESEELRAKLERLNEAATRVGWQAALEEIYESTAYMTSETRLKFLELLPLTEESTILEIGAQHGQITRALARRVGFVHSLEVVPGFAQFAAEWCRQEGLTNVAVACGVDDCRLPFEDASFDGVVLNLVLEWCGSRDPSTPLEESQRRMLRECSRVLRPGGWIYLMTKNRFGMVHLNGAHDQHTFGWRFGQAVPRWLLALRMRLQGKSRVRRPASFVSRAPPHDPRCRILPAAVVLGGPGHRLPRPPRARPDRRPIDPGGPATTGLPAGGVLQGGVPVLAHACALVKYLTSSLAFLAEKSPSA